ncbi:MAG: hypothetical protein JO092_09805 [Candidatus Eremiobacteraeota bacterium]|nr:hypothetical protein [Candidatus Eremiobacteraeota bacterium]MBV8374143.1 hypothetical protein [Candidatus Eremiobacteraeota bacterium]
MLLFRSEEHVDKWCHDWRLSRGAALTLGQCWRLADAWYSADRRDPNWRRRTPAEAQALFAQLGLTSPFWNLG